MAIIHALCIPLPAQGHITPMLHFAKLLNSNGVHITFLNSEYNHRRLLKANGPNSLDGTPSFQFESFPDGLPPTRGDVNQAFPALLLSLAKNGIEAFVNVLRKVNDSASGRPPVTLLICDCLVPFAPGIPRVVPDLPLVFFWPASACSFLGTAQFATILEKGILPFQDDSFMTDGSLDKVILDWVPSMKNVRIRDLPTFIRTTDENDPILYFALAMCKWCLGSPIVFNTFDALEHESLQDISTMVTNEPIYSIGALHTQVKYLQNEEVKSLGSNLWEKDSKCIQWLDSKKPNSVIYVSFGSVAIMTNEELNEFAWGLANTNFPFLWVIRSNSVKDKSSVELSSEFLDHVKGRGLIVTWCDQEEVLNHPSIGVFLTHCGWNSTLESICSGIPVLCWPYFADQPTNCFYSCNRWGTGVEIDTNVKRDTVESQVRDVMEGEKGKEMKRKAIEWKKAVAEAICPNGSSSVNFNNFTHYLSSLVKK